MSSLRIHARTGLIALCSALFVLCMLFVLEYFGFDAQLIAFLSWVQGLGAIGAFWFGLIVVAAVVLLLPTVLLTLGAGFLYGVLQGTVILVLAETIGATIAFLLGRFTLGSRATRYLQQRNRFDVFRKALVSEGWKVTALTRLIPFFPFKLSNYIFGLTPVSTGGYVLGTFIGLWPIALFNVYLGSLAADLLTLGKTGGPQTPFQWFVYSSVLASSLAGLYFLLRWARKAIRLYAETG